MKFNSFAFIFLMPSYNSKEHSASFEKNGFRFKTVAIDMADKSEVVSIAKELASEGYQMIELCGGFGPEWISKVKEALNNKIPVGGVFYGPEFRKSLVDLMS